MPVEIVITECPVAKIEYPRLQSAAGRTTEQPTSFPAIHKIHQLPQQTRL